MASNSVETALYYPGVIWRYGDWVKSLALFFDKVALLVPDYMKDRPMQLDPAIAAGLENAGLLTILSPETLVDRAASERLATELAQLIASGALDRLPPAGGFAELSWSRLGGAGDPGLADMIFQELKAKGLARDSEDGLSVPLHPLVRSLVLVLLAQVMKDQGQRVGMDLSPVTDVPEVHRALAELVGSATPSGTGEVVNIDLEFVAPDLSAVPLDEVLDFRTRYAEEYRAYARALRALARELSSANPEERDSILADRREALADAANDLRRGPLRDIAVSGTMALGLLAGVAGVGEGSVISGALGVATAAAGAAASSKAPPAAFSYLFAMRRELR